uniref:Uncharacterized protein n=1 Tax=Arthrobacter sp. 68b TaxID=311808 RepID=A0A0F7G1N7_9MICC|nr:hypothetical protein [Arthrobacter sp. 68b]
MSRTSAPQNPSHMRELDCNGPVPGKERDWGPSRVRPGRCRDRTHQPLNLGGRNCRRSGPGGNAAAADAPFTSGRHRGHRHHGHDGAGVLRDLRRHRSMHPRRFRDSQVSVTRSQLPDVLDLTDKEGTPSGT